MQPDDFAAICALKYAYFRHLDLKEFDQLAELFTEDATASYQDGKSSFASKDAIMEFLSSSMATHDLISMHHGHHPEIRAVDEETAEGTWYLTDRVILPKMDYEIVGTAFYTDRYVRAQGKWRICHTGYLRVYEEHRTHSTGALLQFTSRFDPQTA
jgi:hypothetical protein